jgi:hypothetical protein
MKLCDKRVLGTFWKVDKIKISTSKNKNFFHSSIPVESTRFINGSTCFNHQLFSERTLSINTIMAIETGIT